MRKRFDEQLQELNRLLINMGAQIETAIGMAAQALATQDMELAEKAVQGDYVIDDMEREIQTLCFKLLLHEQPVARDLRIISAALKMITDMERIGDHAADISEITKMMAGLAYVSHLEHIPQMAAVTRAMVGDAVKAFVTKDLALAQEVIRRDDEVDALFATVRADIINMIRAGAEDSEQAIDLTMIAKYFERIGDHAENIAEWVEFSVTGKHKRLQAV